ncbi:MAG: V-type ATPase 116kDa subunit family protein [Treponemataceae bacterium]|nr:V-type ATPase 116kDa subunit family protein [Treponemataceae bacterium]
MARTAIMRLLELMVLKEDISKVIEYIGKAKCFQFDMDFDESSSSISNQQKDVFDKLQLVRNFLDIDDVEDYGEDFSLPTEQDISRASQIIDAVEDLRKRETEASEEKKRLEDAYKEALSFANLKVPYSQLDHLSFLSLRIGKIDPNVYEDLAFSVGTRGIIIPLGEDKSKILAASSKKGRFAFDSELKKFGFNALEIPENFKGIPDDVLSSMQIETEKAKELLESIQQERKNFADTHKDELISLLRHYSVGMQVQAVQDKLESTQLVYRITGWIPLANSRDVMNDLDELTEGRIAIRQFNPNEVPSVKSGREKVPVKLNHGKIVANFDRMIFSYGSPLYGTIDPTPFVAFFFTLLFGLMFGDAGQGLVFLILGILMTTKVIKNFPVLGSGFGPIFICIGISSTIMGILTGEFFGNGEVLEPVSRFLKGLFGDTSHGPILHLMPSASSIDKLFYFLIFTMGVGFIINSIGLVINIINNFSLGRIGKAIFSKTGICGTIFFWYVVYVAVKTLVFKSTVGVFDFVVLGVCLLGIFFSEPLTHLVEGHRPIMENGLVATLVEGIVELLEVVSSYLSNSVSFLRVGAFALAHAVLGYIIFTMTSLIQSNGGWGGTVGSIAVSIFGNLLVIVLEGMIVAIQVVRLQYYEFFSKFFTETGREFEPFEFKYK